MGEVLNLESSMGPVVKGGYPGLTLAELVLKGFFKFGSQLATKRDDDGKVIEVYQRVKDKEFYQLSSVDIYNTYFNNLASKLKKQLDETKYKAEVKV